MHDHEEEPLEQWAARRKAKARPVGKLKAVPMGGSGSVGGAHVGRDEPRLIMGWDGYQWLPEAVAPDYPAAQRILNGIEGDGVMRATVAPTLKKPGRHRRTT
ncbi:hypothetical protein F4556_005017 [Kitasatospora gansuensis]|uniref:Uncharacterized protein n=1 Tax=Kitasatospora gansuensis TaxID=258050 RepID=A0A7W7WJ48_9ACTN|nr:DUF6087 family protein [Kitasatospora gansuensis]MBB4949482.1 hypothetical protein [Kitasatospora gansuensis]